MSTASHDLWLCQHLVISDCAMILIAPKLSSASYRNMLRLCHRQTTMGCMSLHHHSISELFLEDVWLFLQIVKNTPKAWFTCFCQKEVTWRSNPGLVAVSTRKVLYITDIPHISQQVQRSCMFHSESCAPASSAWITSTLFICQWWCQISLSSGGTLSMLSISSRAPATSWALGLYAPSDCRFFLAVSSMKVRPMTIISTQKHSSGMATISHGTPCLWACFCKGTEGRYCTLWCE